MDLEQIKPREISGSQTIIRYDYQFSYTANRCIEMLDNPEIKRVYSEFHDDCVVEFESGFYEFCQVKGIKKKFLSKKLFLEIISKAYENYKNHFNNCRCIIVSNTQVNSDINKFKVSREHIKRSIQTSDEEELFNSYLKSLEKVIIDVDISILKNLLLEIEIIDEVPSFSELGEKNYTLDNFNMILLEKILLKKFGIEFEKEDISYLYDILKNLIREKSKSTLRQDKFITSDFIIDYLKIPDAQRKVFEKSLDSKEIEELANQSILEAKLKRAKFGEEFIQRAKLIRYQSKFITEKLSKSVLMKNLVDEFEYRLRNICVDIFEEFSREKNINSYLMLKKLEKCLIELASEKKYEKLEIDVDFIKGLIFEATSECVIRWSNE